MRTGSNRLVPDMSPEHGRLQKRRHSHGPLAGTEETSQPARPARSGRGHCPGPAARVPRARRGSKPRPASAPPSAGAELRCACRDGPMLRWPRTGRGNAVRFGVRLERQPLFRRIGKSVPAARRCGGIPPPCYSREMRSISRSKNPTSSTWPMNSAFAVRPDTPHQSATVIPSVNSPFVSISTLMKRPENSSGRSR